MRGSKRAAKARVRKHYICCYQIILRVFLDVKPNLTDGGGGNYSQHNNINQKIYILKLGVAHHGFGAAGGGIKNVSKF